MIGRVVDRQGKTSTIFSVPPQTRGIVTRVGVGDTYAWGRLLFIRWENSTLTTYEWHTDMDPTYHV